MKELLFDWDNIERRQVDELWTPDEIYEEADEDLLRRFKEDGRLERKSAGITAEFLATYFSMWANTGPIGGILAIGVEDDGEITGCTSDADSLVNSERRIRCDLVPDARFDSKKILVHRKDGTPDFVWLIRVYFREDKVVETNKHEAYTRWSNSRHLLTNDERKELEIERGQVSFELEPCAIKYPDEFNTVAINNWVQNVRKLKKIHVDQKITDILVRHRLGKIEKGIFVPNIACALLFAKFPQDAVAGCMLRIQRIEGWHIETGKNRNVVKEFTFTGTVPEIIEQAAGALDSQIRTYSRLGDDGKFYTAPEYPMEAWYEVIVNACVHRSYSLRGMNIWVRMFNDRLEVESPGAFPALVTPQNIYEMHHRRNWWLMDAMLYLDMVKCENEGVKRIRDSMAQMDLPAPEFEQKNIGGAVVRVTLRNNQEARKQWIDTDVGHIVGETVAAQLNAHEKRIVNFIAEHKKIKVTEAMKLMSNPRWGTAETRLKRLVTMNVLVRVSKKTRDPNSYYTFVALAPEDPADQQH